MMATKLESMGSKLFLNTTLADVWFVIDKEEIPGHKVILAFSCPYFETMLYGQTNEAKAKRIELKQANAKQFKEVIRFCYLQSVVVTGWTVEDLIELLALAHEYQHTDLVQHVSDIIEKSINVQVLHQVFAAASLLELPQLVEKCLLCADSHLEGMLLGSVFKEYSVDLVCALISRTFFRDHCGKMLLPALSSWRSYHTESELRTVLNKVDWSKVPFAHVNVIMKELLASHHSVSKLTCWGELKIEEISGDQCCNIQLLTRAKYSEEHCYQITGQIACDIRNVRDTVFFQTLVLTLKKSQPFELSFVEVYAVESVIKVEFNDVCAQVPEKICDNIPVKFVARFPKPLLAVKKNNVLSIHYNGFLPPLEVCIHGALLKN